MKFAIKSELSAIDPNCPEIYVTEKYLPFPAVFIDPVI
jgi:hypothetical protein